MTLISIMRQVGIDKLRAQYGFERKVSEWVSIDLTEQLKDEEAVYESNRYDMLYRDPVTRQQYQTYFYFNEDLDFLYAVDSHVLRTSAGTLLPIVNTPLFNIARNIA